MLYRRLGNTDLQISAVTLGAWAIGGLFWGGADEKDSIEAIHRSLHEGVTTIDTAPVYGCGYSEEVVGRAIKGQRGKAQILTKFGLRWDVSEGEPHFKVKGLDGKPIEIRKIATRKSVVEECENSLRRLGVDHIDLYQHHWPDPVAPIEETFSAVEKLIREGKIRYAGVSNYSAAQIEEARKIVPIVSNQPPYSMIRRDIETELLPWCREQNIGVIVYSPLQMGLLTGKVTEDREFEETDIRSTNKLFSKENRKRVNAFLKNLEPIADAHDATVANVVVNWTIRQPGITAALVGARNAKQAAENAKAASFELDNEQLKLIGNALEGLRLEV